MAREFSVDFLARDLEEVIRHYPERGFQNMKVAYRRSMGRFRATFIRRSPVLKGKGASQRSPGPSAGKGKSGLDKTFRWFVGPKSGTIDDLRANFFTDSRAAVGLERQPIHGPRKGKYLTIPIGYARTGAGRVKARYRSMEKRVKERGGFRGNYFQTKEANGTRIVWERQGKSRGGATRKGRPKPVWLLVPRARSRTHLGLFREWERFQPRVLFRVREALEATLDGKRIR